MYKASVEATGPCVLSRRACDGTVVAMETIPMKKTHLWDFRVVKSEAPTKIQLSRPPRHLWEEDCPKDESAPSTSECRLTISKVTLPLSEKLAKVNLLELQEIDLTPPRMRSCEIPARLRSRGSTLSCLTFQS